MQVRKHNGAERALAVNRPVVRIVSPVEAYLDDRGGRKVSLSDSLAPFTACYTALLLSSGCPLFFGTQWHALQLLLFCNRRTAKICILVCQT